jgi:hypothetical protein
MRRLVPHTLDFATARRVADLAFRAYEQRYAKYHPTLLWLGPGEAEASFSALGLTIRGKIELLPDSIAFELEVPIVLRVFTDRAQAAVEREVRRWCELAAKGEA